MTALGAGKRVAMTASQHARYMRAEIEAIAESLRVHELARLLELGRILLEVQDEPDEHRAGERQG